MAQTNYTPISLYYSTTASAVPTAANLVPGELAINTADGKLYYEDSSGVVQVLATKSTGSIGGSNTQVQFNNSGSLGGSSGLTWDGSFLTTSSIKNSALTSGRVTYAGASGLLSDNANFVYDSSERLIVGASSAAIGNRMEVVSNTGSQAIGIRGRVSDGAGVISWHPNASATEYARIQSDSNSALMFGTGSSGTERMRITSAGLVGIGTSSPSYTLDVTGQIRASSGASASALIATSTSSGGTALNIQNSGTVNALIGGWLSCIGSGNATDVAIAAYQGALGFATNGANIRMTLDSSGNLGIGATSAGNKLQISNGGANGVEFDVALASGTESKMLSINRTSSAYTPLNYDASLHKFFISGGQKMQLDASGNLLVGTTTTRANAGDVQVSKGISFPATQSAQSDANTLDDYEEGTWTPGFGTGWVTSPSVATTATYVKIGKQVTVSVYLLDGVSTAGALITGLPFSVSVESSMTGFSGSTSTAPLMTGVTQSGTSQIRSIPAATMTSLYWTVSTTYFTT